MENELAIRKAQLRSEILMARLAVPDDEWQGKSREIYRKVINQPAFLNAETLFAFVDAKGEADTRELIRAGWAAGKRVAVPRVEHGVINFYYIQAFTDLEPGGFGIEEPKRHCPIARPDPHTLMIMPGVGFDTERNRLGYGGGYYDRYLSANPGIRTIAIAFALQMRQSIPCSAEDLSPDILITEAAVYEKY